MSEFKLAAARYGKDSVRVFRVIRPSLPGGQHQVVEYNVCLLLEGDIETRYAGSLWSLLLINRSLARSPTLLDETIIDRVMH